MTKKTKTRVKSHAQLGRTVESIFEGGYTDHGRVYRINFVRGIFFGLGAAIGGTIVVAIIVWILSLFSEIPLIGDFFNTISDSINEQ